MSGLLLDTCAVIFVSEARPMRKAAVEALAGAAGEQENGMVVSPVSALEIGMLVARGRLSIAHTAESWFEAFLSRAGVALAKLPLSVLIASSFLPGGPLLDPWDRIIAATAREYGYSVVTRDRALLDYARAGHINAVEC